MEEKFDEALHLLLLLQEERLSGTHKFTYGRTEERRRSVCNVQQVGSDSEVGDNHVKELDVSWRDHYTTCEDDEVSCSSPDDQTRPLMTAEPKENRNLCHGGHSVLHQDTSALHAQLNQTINDLNQELALLTIPDSAPHGCGDVSGCLEVHSAPPPNSTSWKNTCDMHQPTTWRVHTPRHSIFVLSEGYCVSEDQHMMPRRSRESGKDLEIYTVDNMDSSGAKKNDNLFCLRVSMRHIRKNARD